MKSLENRPDIELLVNLFYTKVQNDTKIGHYFTDIAKVNWELHLPKMYDFWESILFGAAAYKGNPMAVHFPVNAQKPIEKEHFNHWLSLWKESVQSLFEGEIAELAVQKATNIANLMAFKMETATKLESR